MIKPIFFAIFALCTTMISAQKYTSVADSLRQNGIRRLANIAIEEVDSTTFFRKKPIDRRSRSEWIAAFYYAGPWSGFPFQKIWFGQAHFKFE